MFDGFEPHPLHNICGKNKKASIYDIRIIFQILDPFPAPLRLCLYLASVYVQYVEFNQNPLLNLLLDQPFSPSTRASFMDDPLWLDWSKMACI